MSGRFPKFNLTDKQIRGIANIVLHEQGTIAGWFAEASQIANLAEIRYGGDPVKAVCSGWYAKGTSRYKAGTSNQTVINIVKRVLCEGFRTLPRYINEHDCMSDISSVVQNGKGVKSNKALWKPHTTVIKNRMGATYYFWDFPGGYKTTVDPFGYTSKALREKYGDFCYTVAEAQAGVDPHPDRLLSLLAEYHAYIKAHSKYFINKYDSSMTTFAKAKKAVEAEQSVGITCVVPLRWALAEMGIKNKAGKYLISAPGGSFKAYYTGDMTKYLKHITSGGPVSKTIIQAIDAGLLKAGDIVCFENLTHTFVYSGSGYKFYEGGGACVKDGHYPAGILVDYSKNSYKSRIISEVLRLNGTGTKTMDFKMEEYNMTTIKKGSSGDIVKVWQVITKVVIDGDFGSKTEAATKEFQKKHGLTVDGIVGKFTWGKGLESIC